MNVRFSLGSVGTIGKGMRTGWCMVFLGMFAVLAFHGQASAENTAATRTTLAVATSNAGERTRATLTAHVTVSEASGAPAGVVTFRSGKTDLGSAVLDAEGNASLQTDLLPAGTQTVQAVYEGQANYLTSVSQPEQVRAVVSAVAGFTVAAAPTSLSTAVGGFVSTNVTVTPNNGFTGYVSLSCEGLPVNTTCTFSPVSVLAACTSSAVCTPGTSLMQIQTQAPSPGATASIREGGSRLTYAFVLPALLGLAGLGGSKRPWRNLLLVLFTFAGLMSMTACAARYRYLNHGPPGNPGTPVGSFTVTIESQSSSGSVTLTPPANPQLALTVTAK